MLAIDQLTKIYPGDPPVKALDGVSLSAPGGAFVTIVGPSGCGKSTLLKCIAGIEIPTSGTMTFDGADFLMAPPAARGVEWLPQRVGATFLPGQSIQRNLTLGFRLSGRPSPEASRVEDAASRLGIKHILNKRPRETSGGELQRAALARALLSKPRVFLLDEPLASLDDVRRRELKDLLLGFRTETNAIFFYVTHDHDEALSLADLCIIMRDGAIVQAAAPEELYKKPASMFAAEFLSNAGLNKLRGDWSSHARQESKPPLWLCFRPETVLIDHVPQDARRTIDLGAATLESASFEGARFRARYRLHTSPGAVVVVSAPAQPPSSAHSLRVGVDDAFFFDGET